MVGERSTEMLVLYLRFFGTYESHEAFITALSNQLKADKSTLAIDRACGIYGFEPIRALTIALAKVLISPLDHVAKGYSDPHNERQTIGPMSVSANLYRLFASTGYTLEAMVKYPLMVDRLPKTVFEFLRGKPRVIITNDDAVGVVFPLNGSTIPSLAPAFRVPIVRLGGEFVELCPGNDASSILGLADVFDAVYRRFESQFSGFAFDKSLSAEIAHEAQLDIDDMHRRGQYDYKQLALLNEKIKYNSDLNSRTEACIRRINLDS